MEDWLRNGEENGDNCRIHGEGVGTERKWMPL